VYELKIAIIVVRLVPEGDEVTDSQIEKEVRAPEFIRLAYNMIKPRVTPFGGASPVFLVKRRRRELK